MEEKKEKTNLIKKIKENKKLLISVIVVAVILALALIFSTVFAVINLGNTNIIKGIYINDIDMSGMSQSEAKEKLEALTNEKLAKELNVSYKEYNTTVNATVLELSYNINNAVEEAYSIGRNGNLFSNNYEILNTLFNDKKIDIDITLNEEAIKTIDNDISTNLPDSIVQSSYYIEEKELIITKGKRGTKVDEDQFTNKIKEMYANLSNNISDIEIPVIEKDPEAIDIDKIHEEIYTEAKDAYYNEQPFEIYPEVEGVDFNIEEAKEIIKTDQEEYKISLIITKPKVTIADLSSIAFKDVLATFSTRYDASNTDRTTNLKLAAGKINGTVLAAGAEFSYNRVVGERTIAAGYKEAKVYSNGEVVDGLGGGICQISSTLYNAAVMANLEITQRRNHQFVTSYLPAGRDATVVYGSQDFKFKNTRKYPIKLEVSVSNGMAKVNIYGIKENPEYEISFQTNTISTIPFATTYEEDDSLPAGTEKVKQKGTNGLVTETYKIAKSNGTVVSKTLLSKDVYNAMQKIVIMGTAGGEATVTPTPAPTPAPTPIAEPEKPVIPTEPETPKSETTENTTVTNTTTPEEE